MAEARVERRLAAILAADVAGYSRLMGTDEVGTLAALKAHRREVVDPAIAQHHGRIVKTTGDGMLVEFASAVDAVTCAITIYAVWPAPTGSIIGKLTKRRYACSTGRSNSTQLLRQLTVAPPFATAGRRRHPAGFHSHRM
jgi:adenylate cyclase